MNDLPRSLIHFETVLGEAVRRDLRPRTVLRRPVARFSIAAAAAAAVALGVLNVLPGNGPSVVQRAAAAITGSDSPDSILHVSATVTGNGGDSSWSVESWQENSAPFDTRWLQIGPGNLRLETVSGYRSTQIYDSSTDTIYTSSPSKVVLATLTQYGFAVGGSDCLLAGQACKLLQSGDLAVSGRATVNGRDALRLVSSDGQTEFDVDPQTYHPIEFRTSNAGVPETVSFEVFEELPPSHSNEALVSLTAQHPTARVDANAADFAAAVARLGGQH